MKKNNMNPLNGYIKKLQKPIRYEYKPALHDMMEVKPKKHFWNNTFKKQSKKLSNSNFEEFMKNAPIDIIDDEKLKIVAEINDIYLTFKNPAEPSVKNLVLRGPSLKIYEGKVHAVIGESGSGKSVITSLLYGLTGNNAVIESGSVKLYGLEVHNFTLKDWEKAKLRGRIVSAIFQNPMSILDPTTKVGFQIMEGMLINKVVKNKKEAYNEAVKYLKMTKINNPEKVMNLYPHELSGGMIQRIAIAAIISLKPKLIVMDEPTTALDPTVQALVLDIIHELQQLLKISIVFITHDLGVVASIADYINIMYAGQIVETGTREEILKNPQHPYTWGLISAMPDFNTGKKLGVIRGAVPSNLNNIVGDAFAVRNDYALGIDFEQEPPMYQISETHFVKSNLFNEKASKIEEPKIIKYLWNIYNTKMNEKYGSAAKTYVNDTTQKHYEKLAAEHNKKIDEFNKINKKEA
ncbi:ABC transporter ATP-binding protein [Mycoplasma phocoenae]|uniref:ABC transporter ATP-binding protein n=1 Tax=Mycoplasma phocoenae TaxID=754517 RepID=A0A858U2X9_9MOLU|nr:ABC transporter ATP-binding protein [Mycoplasma phocoenae]QJG66772.1 ABC transporter ATP-binding protein [Mycoplasma phocoenae]